MKRLTIICSPLLIALVLPVWKTWYIGFREATPEFGWVWNAVRMFPANVEEVGVATYLTGYSLPNLGLGLILLFVGVGIDRSSLARRERRRDELGLCPACGYDTRVTPTRCPKCGRKWQRI